MDRDQTDHWRFAPIQTNTAQQLCHLHQMPPDVSTAILLELEEQRADEGGDQRPTVVVVKPYSHSDAVLRLFLPFVWYYHVLAKLLLGCVPKVVRDLGYRLFARNRGAIWKTVKSITGMGNTHMAKYRDKIIGLEDMEELPELWGFEETGKEEQKDGSRKKEE